ncbi:hypothetical protein EP7_004657 [Isosphaeraceae bacterium EP7]
MWNRTSRRIALFALISGALAPMTADAQDVQGKEVPDPPKAQRKDGAASERVSGVIVKVDRRPGDGPKDKLPVVVTVNADVIWSDWARDQATLGTVKTTDKAARAGAKSVATEGQPKDKDNLIVIELGPDSKIETRFRASTDETTKGSATPAGAREGSVDPAAKDQATDKDKKPLTLKPADLKDGLFVEVDYRRASASKNLAASLVVLRPIGGPDTAADAAKEDATKPVRAPIPK